VERNVDAGKRDRREAPFEGDVPLGLLLCDRLLVALVDDLEQHLLDLILAEIGDELLMEVSTSSRELCVVRLAFVKSIFLILRKFKTLVIVWRAISSPAVTYCWPCADSQ
jgi:hypothetical protein